MQTETNAKKKMWKVVSPIPGKDGNAKYWMRLGTGFTNRDESINVYLDAMPIKGECVIQLREFTEEDFANRNNHNSHSDRSHANGGGYQQRAAFSLPQPVAAPANADIPF